MHETRKRYIIASALFEYIINEKGKPQELQRQSDLEDMQIILITEYKDLLGVLEKRKQIGHLNLASTINLIDD